MSGFEQYPNSSVALLYMEGCWLGVGSSINSALDAEQST